MAKPNLTSEERLAVYQLLYQINRSFHLIVRRLSQAEALNMLNRQDAHDMLGLTQEVQLELNTLVLDRFSALETGDLAQFGKVRAAMEKRLRS
jgi:hypothetical protein